MCFPMHRFYNFKNYIRKRKSHRLVNYIKRTHVMSNESTVNSHQKNHNGQFSASLRDGRCFCASKSRSASSRFQGSHARFQEFRHYHSASVGRGDADTRYRTSVFTWHPAPLLVSTFTLRCVRLEAMVAQQPCRGGEAGLRPPWRTFYTERRHRTTVLLVRFCLK